MNGGCRVLQANQMCVGSWLVIRSFLRSLPPFTPWIKVDLAIRLQSENFWPHESTDYKYTWNALRPDCDPVGQPSLEGGPGCNVTTLNINMITSPIHIQQLYGCRCWMWVPLISLLKSSFHTSASHRKLISFSSSVGFLSVSITWEDDVMWRMLSETLVVIHWTSGSAILKGCLPLEHCSCQWVSLKFIAKYRSTHFLLT